jgi:hypothetical protein
MIDGASQRTSGTNQNRPTDAACDGIGRPESAAEDACRSSARNYFN